MDGGVSTASITWITKRSETGEREKEMGGENYVEHLREHPSHAYVPPLLAGMSNEGGSTMTLASLIVMDGLVATVTESRWKLPVGAGPFTKSAENTALVKVW